MACCDIVRPGLALLFLTACGGTQAAPVPAPGPVRAELPEHAAYVVYYARETHVIPVHPARDPFIARDIVVQNDTEDGSAVTALRITSDVPAAAQCPCVGTSGACDVSTAPLVTRATRTDGGVQLLYNMDPVDELTRECACLVTGEQRFWSEQDEESCDDFESDAALVSFVGGELHVSVRYGAMYCDTEESEPPYIETVYAFEDARPPDTTEMSERYCVRGIHLDPRTLASARRIECETPSEEDEDLCEACLSAGQGTVPALHRGRLYALAPVFGEYDEATGVSYREATHEACGAANDPCGDPRGLDIPSGASFWVARDGSSALVYHGDRWLVLGRGAETAAVIWVRDRGHPVGVRYHADARPLFEELRARTLGEALARVPQFSASQVEVTHCTSDEMCAGSESCEHSFCGQDGQCHDGRNECDVTHPCSDGESVCQPERERCVHPGELEPSDSDVLAREDQRYARTRPRDNGVGWARRCHAHVARGKHEEAYGACVRALDARPSARTELGVVRDLILIARARRALDEADAWREYSYEIEEEAEEEEPEPPPRRRRQR